MLLLDEELHHGGAEAGVREHADLLGDVAEIQGSVTSLNCEASLGKNFKNAKEYYYWKFKEKIFLLLNLHHI